MQKMFRSFIKNGKERKNIAFFWKERVPNPVQLQRSNVEYAPINFFLPIVPLQ